MNLIRWSSSWLWFRYGLTFIKPSFKRQLKTGMGLAEHGLKGMYRSWFRSSFWRVSCSQWARACGVAGGGRPAALGRFAQSDPGSGLDVGPGSAQQKSCRARKICSGGWWSPLEDSTKTLCCNSVRGWSTQADRISFRLATFQSALLFLAKYAK